MRLSNALLMSKKTEAVSSKPSWFGTSAVVEDEQKSLPVLAPFSFEREMRLFLRSSLSFP